MGLGSSSSGKTSLCRALTNNPFLTNPKFEDRIDKHTVQTEYKVKAPPTSGGEQLEIVYHDVADSTSRSWLTAGDAEEQVRKYMQVHDEAAQALWYQQDD